MKLRKMFSALCAIAMLTAVLPTVSAAEAEPLSEYAGQTIAVQAVEETESGLTSRVVDVAIPEGATEAEARTLILATAFDWDMMSVHSDNFAVTDLGNKRNFTLVRNEEVLITSRTLKSELNEIYATFVVSSYTPNFKIQSEARNNTTDTASGWLNANTVSTVDSTVVREVIFKLTNIRMNANDQIEIYGRSDLSVDISHCNVTGYYRY